MNSAYESTRHNQCVTRTSFLAASYLSLRGSEKECLFTYTSTISPDVDNSILFFRGF